MAGSDFNVMKERAETLRRDKQYAEALAAFDDLLNLYPDQARERERWGKAYCLRALGRQSEALNLCREVYRSHPEFAPNRNLYGWCVYDLEIKPAREGEPADVKTFFKAAEAITQLTLQEAYSPYERTVFEVLRYLKERQTYPADQVLAWCDKLDPDQLSTESRTYTGRDGKERVEASPLEQWYSNRTKALEHLRRWEELIVVCNEALDRLTEFHYSDDIWFRRRIATAKAELGDTSAAIGDLKALVRLKPDWFIQAELARLLHQAGHDEEALDYAVDAALGPAELHYKWELFVLMGDLLAAQGKPELAGQHYRLASAVRAGQGWREDADLAQQLRALPPAPDQPAAELARELEGTWRALKFADQERNTGEIERADAGKRNGFIRTHDGRRIFFRYRSFVSPRDRLMIGAKVSFFLQSSFDKTKNRDSQEAVDIREIG